MIYTIGYYGFTLKGLIRKLDEHGIQLLVDVRTHPNSRYRREFNRRHLEKVLGKRYVWKGDCLGGLSEVKQPGYNDCIAWLAEKGKTENVSVMCMEADPKDCHRDSWIARDLKTCFGVDVVHILRKPTTKFHEGRKFAIPKNCFILFNLQSHEWSKLRTWFDKHHQVNVYPGSDGEIFLMNETKLEKWRKEKMRKDRGRPEPGAFSPRKHSAAQTSRNSEVI